MSRETAAKPMSTRALLRAFQTVHRDGVSDEFMADFQLLQHKDLDLSIRLGALLAFDALLITTGINPIAASPGAPVSLDAPTQPLEVLITTVGVALIAMSAAIVVRAITIGEEFSAEGIEDDPNAIVRRMFAAFCVSVDAQTRLLRIAARFTIAGGAVIAATFAWIIAAKIFAG
ncbi:MAG: hypothetical protein ACKVOP_11790 [Sphingomonadaceae bacterium]